MLAQGPPAFGHWGEIWNGRRVAQVIKRSFGVNYHPDHCRRLLRQMGWSAQKPREQATQRDETAIEEWKEQQWPALKKQAKREKRTRVFVDECGFSLLPMVVRTYAPRGQTPIRRVKLTRDHLGAIGGITEKGRLFMRLQEQAYDAKERLRHRHQMLQNCFAYALGVV